MFCSQDLGHSQFITNNTHFSAKKEKEKAVIIAISWKLYQNKILTNTLRITLSMFLFAGNSFTSRENSKVRLTRWRLKTDKGRSYLWLFEHVRGEGSLPLCVEIFELFMGLKTWVELTLPQPGQRGGGRGVKTSFDPCKVQKSQLRILFRTQGSKCLHLYDKYPYDFNHVNTIQYVLF